MKYGKYFLLSFLVIFIDQLVKYLVHANLQYVGNEVPVFGDWFKLHYTLNEGMAFGLKLGGKYGKIILSVFRLFAMVGIGWYLVNLAKRGVHQGLLWSVALILGGAIGNVVDSTFYGVVYDNAPYGAPTPWFHGQVIDMFYVDICNCHIPSWVPVIGDSYYPLWPIFNIADASIFVGVVIILLGQKKFFGHKEEDKPADQHQVQAGQSAN